MRKKKILLSCLAALLALGLWLWWGNTTVMTHTITVTDSRLPRAFSGFRVAQISDLHNDAFGTGNETLLALLTEAGPDLIVITGDMIDSRRTDVEAALTFAAGAAEIAPTYYVTGNHEQRVPRAFARLEEGLEKLGVRLLRGEGENIWRDGASITLAGVDDVSFYAEYHPGRVPEGLLLEDIQSLREEGAIPFSCPTAPSWRRSTRSRGWSWCSAVTPTGDRCACPSSAAWRPRARGCFPSMTGDCTPWGRPKWWCPGDWATASSPCG